MTGFSERIRRMNSRNDDDIICDMEGFTYTEIKMIRTLVQDRIENRFQYAVKVASDMNAPTLDAVNTEIQRLVVLKAKLMEETEHD